MLRRDDGAHQARTHQAGARGRSGKVYRELKALRRAPRHGESRVPPAGQPRVAACKGQACGGLQDGSTANFLGRHARDAAPRYVLGPAERGREIRDVGWGSGIVQCRRLLRWQQRSRPALQASSGHLAFGQTAAADIVPVYCRVCMWRGLPCSQQHSRRALTTCTVACRVRRLVGGCV